MINAPNHMKDLDMKKYVIYMSPNARLDKRDSNIYDARIFGTWLHAWKHGNEGWQVANANGI